MLTAELSDARLGLLTASMAATICGGLDTDGLRKYVDKLAGERVFGDLGEDSYKSRFMRRGEEVEEEALQWFEFRFELELIRQPFVQHPTISYVSACPDGLPLEERFCVEAKSPIFSTYCEVMRRRQVPSQYRWQCRWQAWCCGFEETRFVAFHNAAQNGIVVPFRVLDEDIDFMTKRAALVNEMVEETAELLRRAA